MALLKIDGHPSTAFPRSLGSPAIGGSLYRDYRRRTHWTRSPRLRASFSSPCTSLTVSTTSPCFCSWPAPMSCGVWDCG